MIIGLILGLAFGSVITYLIIKPKLKRVSVSNQEIEQENLKLENKHAELTSILQKESSEYSALKAQKAELETSLANLREIQTNAANDYYTSALELAQMKFEQAIEKISEELETARADAQKEYAETLRESAAEYQEQITIYITELGALSKKIEEERSVVDTLVAAAKRREEMEHAQDFYRIVLSNEDIEEIKRLRSVIPFLRDKTPLNKVIYKVYYERPLTDMLGRVVGQTPRTGIYKITSLQDEKCYVGQAANIAERWRQHTKRGVGAEDWTQNKLYPAMYSLGVENFSFEILEECDRSELNDKEKFWQQVYHAQDFGYSIK